MRADLDLVERYAAEHNLRIANRTLLVEGTTDVELFTQCAKERNGGAMKLIGQDFSVVAAGERDRGGANGVVRELIALRQNARNILDSRGFPKYRFIALFDNDKAGVSAYKTACGIDASILENRDVFLIKPVLPLSLMLDPGAVGRDITRSNSAFNGLKWEIEDAFSRDFVDAFLDSNPSALIRKQEVGGMRHCELTDDGKAKFHRFVKDSATYEDLEGVRGVLLAMRRYLNLN
jgi:hypothetical protein